MELLVWMVLPLVFTFMKVPQKKIITFYSFLPVEAYAMEQIIPPH
jgi:hypothetical protein